MRFACLLGASLLTGILPAGAVTFSGIIAFGDSLSDRGNTVAELVTILNETDIYNSHFYDHGRWSNGPLWIEDVNKALGFTTWARNDGDPLSGGHDFAWAGSESGTGYTDGFLLANLQTQIDYYQDNLVVGPDLDFEIGTKLFSVWSGGNDVINAVQSGEIIDRAAQEALSTQMADNIAEAVTTLYNAGGRYFIVPNLPDLGKKPNYRTNPLYAAEASEIVALYNPKLAAQIATLRQTLPGITIYAFDAYTILNEVIANPASYGFTNVTKPAYTPNSTPPYYGSVVPNPDQHLFWDTTHPTEAGHSILAQQVLNLIDAAPPTVAVGSAPRHTSGKFIRLRGRAGDDLAVDHIEIKRWQDKFRPVRIVDGKWTAHVRIKPGRNVIRVRAVDVAGKISRHKRIVITR